MSRFRRLSHALWHCQYHLVGVPEYRYRVLKGGLARGVERCIRAFSERLGAEVVALSVQEDHIHLLVMMPPKVSISEFMGKLISRRAIRVFNKFQHLEHKPYGGRHFWARAIIMWTR